MKKISLIIITFSGIYTGFSQNPAAGPDSLTIKQRPESNVRPKPGDSVYNKKKRTMRLFPNPAKNKVEIEIEGFEPGFIQVQLVDKTGQFMRNENRLVYNGNEIITLMFYEEPGLYFVLLKQQDTRLKAALIIK